LLALVDAEGIDSGVFAADAVVSPKLGMLTDCVSLETATKPVDDPKSTVSDGMTMEVGTISVTVLLLAPPPDVVQSKVVGSQVNPA